MKTPTIEIEPLTALDERATSLTRDAEQARAIVRRLAVEEQRVVAEFRQHTADAEATFVYSTPTNTDRAAFAATQTEELAAHQAVLAEMQAEQHTAALEAQRLACEADAARLALSRRTLADEHAAGAGDVGVLEQALDNVAAKADGLADELAGLAARRSAAFVPAMSQVCVRCRKRRCAADRDRTD